jgi:outer membrane protein OmpA-like peptidoglycan-associated protein
MAAPIAHAADAVDAKDDTRFKRFKDSDLIGYETKKYDEYLLPLDDYNTSLNTFNKLEKIEGQITRYVYRVPKGQSSLAAIRHYEEQLKTAKIAKTFELAPDQFKNEANFEDKLFMQNKTDTANIMSPLREGSQVPRYIAAQSNNKAADKSTTVSVMAVERATELQWKKPEMKDPEKEAIALNPGETIVVVDVIESKYHPVASQLSPSTPVVSTDTPDADDMAKQLEENGKVDIYGIYFDVDKTFIKAESNPTLEQVAKLMKANPNLSLKINGHTDNTGSIEHNMKLSDGRAKSVVDKLVKKYGVEKTRLQSEGYGDTKPIASNDTEEGKAKNRRVELSKVE